MEESESEDFFPNCDLSVWFRSCQKQVEKPLEGKTSFGEVPQWLDGSLIRNGPGGVDAYGFSSYKHLFDAPGLLQKFQISDGTVKYTNRFMETKSFLRNTAAQRLILNEFGTVAIPDPCQTIFQRIAAVFLGPIDATLTDTANISIHPFGDEVYSLAETPFAHRIDLENLSTLQTVDVNQELGVINHTSHPHISGSKVYNLGQKLNVWHGPHYIIAEMTVPDKKNRVPTTKTNGDEGGKPSERFQSNSPWSTAEILATIPSRWPLSLCYMHSFALTPNYFIVIEQPLSVFLPTVPLAQIYGDKSISSCLRFYPEEDTIFHVVPRYRSAKDVSPVSDTVGNPLPKLRRTFRAPSLFFLHTINAFEEIESRSSERQFDTMRNNDNDSINSSCSTLSGEFDSVVVVVDICCYNDPSMIDCMFLDALKNAHSNPNYANMFRGRPKRFRLRLSDFDMSASGIMPPAESYEIVDIGCETPKINYDYYDGEPYRYFYAISSDVDLDNPGTLIKVDTVQRTFKKWCEPNGYPSEPIFVPRPDSSTEDDGIILSTAVYGGERVTGPNTTSLIILDAMKWELVCKVDVACESAIPKCLHGWYFPNSAKQSWKCYSHIKSEAQRKLN